MLNRSILITGATGFVGQNLHPYLTQKGFNITSLNLREPNSITTLSNKKINSIIHLAGKAHDHKGVATEAEYYEVNLNKTKEVFDFFVKSEARFFIHFSTVAVITDEKVTGILTEDAEPHPTSAYGKSKLAAEAFLLNERLPEGKKIFILRPAMIHGPGDKGNLTLLCKIVSKGVPYPLAAFDNKRSFLGIDNLCYIIEQLLNNADQVAAGVYNMVDDQPLSSNQVVAIIAEALGLNIKLLNVPKPIVKLIAGLGDVLPLPINSKRLSKLTEDFEVSNKKLKQALQISFMPLSAKEGLMKTIKSFQNK